MTIESAADHTFILRNDADADVVAGYLQYTGDHLQEALLQTAAEYIISHNKRGAWITCEKGKNKETAVCKVGISGTITILYHGKVYQFKKPHSWKPRFVLLNSEKEEIAAFLPSVNWEQKGYDFILQLNEEYSEETDAFLILQALHCAVYSLAMMNGQVTPVVTAGHH